MARKTDGVYLPSFMFCRYSLRLEGAAEGSKCVMLLSLFVLFLLTGTLNVSAYTTLDNSSLFETISHRIVVELIEKSKEELLQEEQQMMNRLLLVNSEGSCSGIDYSSTHRTHWEPLKHLDLMILFALGYTNRDSRFYQSEQIEKKLLAMFQFWLNQSPRSNNWYQNQIAEPQRMGQLLLLLQTSQTMELPDSLLQALTHRMKEKGGAPQAQKGANRVDVALHGVYRACLLKDEKLLQEAFQHIYSTITYTDQPEGIQYDHSFTQHGRQLHIGSYGDVFLAGVVKACSYAVNTPFEIPPSKLQILSNLITRAYMPAIRGEYISYNVIGRSSSRPNGTSRKAQTAIFEQMCLLDRVNERLYKKAIQRLNGTEPPSFGVGAYSHHFYCSDYTLHQRPSYLIDVRMLSNRTVRNEYLKDNGEGIKQYFMSYGAMGIYIHGNEYNNLFPVWDYNRIPGVTAPYMNEVPRANSYIKKGANSVAGGVSNGIYSVAAYQMEDYDTLYQVNSKTNKAWFFFDKEVVCMGNSIVSETDYPVYTTINQTLLQGEVVVSKGGGEQTLTLNDSLDSNQINWIYHNGVGYYLNGNPQVTLSIKEKEGSWSDINTNFSSDPIRKELFTLSIDHGVLPQQATYSYLILPALGSSNEMKTYDVSSIEILENSKQAIIVWHKKLQLIGAIFYEPSKRTFAGISFESTQSCVVLFENIDSEKLTLHVADPTNEQETIELKIRGNGMKRACLIKYTPEVNQKGSTLSYPIKDML